LEYQLPNNDKILDRNRAALERRFREMINGLVLLPDPEPHLEELLTRGREFAVDRLRMRRGERHRCHANATRFWYESGGSIAIATGYAYDGGLWFQHSWGLDGDRVIETTHRSVRYFGVELTTGESLSFLFANDPDLIEKMVRDLKEGKVSPSLVLEMIAIAEATQASPPRNDVDCGGTSPGL
jgi:hypothetical protein